MGYIGAQPTPVPLGASDLQDGIITTAKIADLGVTEAKLGNLAVAAGKLKAGAGGILQIQEDVSWSGLSGQLATIPLVLERSDSKILILMDSYFDLQNGATATQTQIRWDDSGSQVAIANAIRYDDGGTALHYTAVSAHVYKSGHTKTAGQTLNIEVYLPAEAYVSLAPNGSNPHLTVLEIA